MISPMRARRIVFAALAAAALVAAIAALAPDRAASRPSHRGVVKIAATGDIAMLAGPADSYFAGVSRYLKGNVVLGNLEGTLTDRGASKCGAGSSSCFAFRAPPSYARYLRSAGFNIMNLANNHAYDFGSIGQADTVAALRRVGLRHTGRPGEIAFIRTGGVRVAVVGFAPYPWAQSLTDIAGAESLVRRADARADVVVVTFHGGAEGSDQMQVRPQTEYFLGENRGNVVTFSHAVVDAGADLVVGHGPHVLRGMEWYRGRLIAYSLGNFQGYRAFATGGALSVSGILKVSLRSDGTWAGGSLVPITLANSCIPARDPAEAAHGVVRKLSRQDFGRRGMRVSFSGVLLPPG